MKFLVWTHQRIIDYEWDDERHSALEEQCKAEIITAYKEAEKHGTLSAGPWASEETLFEDVYKKPPRHLRKQRQELGI